MKYLVLRETDNTVVNAIVWDGSSPYEEPGCYLVELPADPAGVWIGWQLIDGAWVAPVTE